MENMEKTEKENKEKARKKWILDQYANETDVLKRIPNDLKEIDENIVLNTKDLELQIEKNKLAVKDYELRSVGFEILPNQAKFKWEESTEWAGNQKALLVSEINIIKFKIDMDRISIVKTKSSLEAQKADVERQKERCMVNHKLWQKELKDIHGFSNEQVSELKKKCSSPCCR